MYRLYLKVNQRILYSYYGPVWFCLRILYQEQRVSPSSPPLPPPFYPRFYFRATARARKCSLIRISSGSKLGRHVYAFTSKFNIYHKNPLLSQALALYTTKQGKQAANSFISFNTLASPGGHWQQHFFGQRNFQKMGVGVSLLGMVPVDYSVKNYRSKEKMKDKLLPLDKSHVQRVVKDKSTIPRDTRNRMLSGGGHITRRSSVGC